MTQKLDVGKVFSRIFELYTSQASVYLPAALIIYLPYALIAGAVLTGTGGLFLALLIFGLLFVTVFIYQGIVVRSVEDLQDGQRDFSIGELFRSVLPVLGMLIVVGLVGGIAIVIGLVLLVIPGLILVTIWAVVAPAVVIERKGFDAFGRSYELTKGNFWQVLAVIVVLFVIQVIIQQIFGAIGRGISDSFLPYAIFTLIGNVLVAPLISLAAAVMYFELLGLKSQQPVAAAPGPPGTVPPPPPSAPPPTAPPPPPAAPPSERPPPQG